MADSCLNVLSDAHGSRLFQSRARRATLARITLQFQSEEINEESQEHTQSAADTPGNWAWQRSRCSAKKSSPATAAVHTEPLTRATTRYLNSAARMYRCGKARIGVPVTGWIPGPWRTGWIVPKVQIACRQGLGSCVSPAEKCRQLACIGGYRVPERVSVIGC